MLLVQLLTFMLTTVVHMHCIDFEAESSSSRHRPMKRSVNSEGCGIRGHEYSEVDDEITARILGGSDSTSKWPWMVAISFNGDISCGGSVIGERHVITAAHCFDKSSDPELFTVQVGEMSPGESGISYKVESVHVHEGYSASPDYYNDIAIMILRDKLPDDSVPICLPEEDTVLEGDTLTIIGFGVLQEDSNDASEILQEMHGIKVISNEKCDTIAKNMDKTKSGITENQICSGDSVGGKGVCAGDSGGPVSIERDGQYIIVGMVAYGFICGMEELSGVYTKVFPYLTWIEKHIGKQD